MVAVYRPDSGLDARLRLVAAQVSAIVVVDDGSGADRPAADIEFVALSENRGIATALNVGIARARELDATHVLTLDQDTELGPDFVETSLATFARATSTRIGATAADRINGASSIPTWVSSEGIALAPEAIQSGMLISIDCLDDVGPLDERLFIDSVDREFCHRIRARGWSLAIATGSSVAHAIGQLEPLRNGVQHYEWHEPFRQYYIVRNGLVVARRFRRREPEWARVLLRQTITESWKICVNGPRRFKHVVASVAGLVDGAFGRGGRIPSALERFLR